MIFYKISNIIGVILISAGVANFIGLPIGIMAGLLLGVASYLIYRYLKVSSLKGVRLVVSHVVAVGISFGIGTFSFEYFNSKLSKIATVWEIITYIGVSLWIMPLVCALVSKYIAQLKTYKRNVSEYVYLLVVLTAISFVLCIYLPSQVFLTNPNEFIFSYQVLLTAMIPVFLQIIILGFLTVIIFPPKIYHGLVNLTIGIILAMYVQVVFMNGDLKELDGQVFEWRKHAFSTVLDGVIWILLIVLPFIIDRILRKNDNQKNANKIKLWAVCGLLFVQITGMVTNICNASEKSFSNVTYSFSAKDQFNVSKSGNIIVMVIDAVDNMYIEDILSEDPEFFDEFKDFTLYDNTCSVYDFTATSVNQMFTGYMYGDEVNYCDEFYNRIHDAGYKVHLYGFQSHDTFPDIYEHIDNCQEMYLDDKEKCLIWYDEIANDYIQMALYQSLPNILKGNIEVNSLAFNHIFCMEENDDTYFDNEDFAEHMKFSVEDDSNMYLIQYHISGAHFPCDDYVGTTRDCLIICKDMIEQLKALDVYDNTTIIIMADHGFHDQAEPYHFPMASTPMFMIKEQNVNRDAMLVSSAPIYHKDFLATILVNMELFDKDNDYEKFGTSIYDFKDGDMRERSFYDRAGDGYYKYTYTGDYDELRRVVDAGEYEEVRY